MLWTYPCTVSECEKALRCGFLYCAAQHDLTRTAVDAGINSYLQFRERQLASLTVENNRGKNKTAIQRHEELFCVRFATLAQGLLEAALLDRVGTLLHLDIPEEPAKDQPVMSMNSYFIHPVDAVIAQRNAKEKRTEQYALVVGNCDLAHHLQVVQHIAKRAPATLQTLVSERYPRARLNSLYCSTGEDTGGS